MIIIIPRLPDGTTYRQVESFLAPALKKSFFSFKKYEVDRIKITSYLDKNTNMVEIHALIFVSDKKLGERIIQRLNRKMFNQIKRVAVREYFIRSYHNDRRNIPTKTENEVFVGSRVADRRRGKHLEEVIHPITMFSSHKSFTRKLT